MWLRIAALALGVVGAAAAPTVPWPGDAPARTADAAGSLGGNLSGLALAGESSLWAVRDDPSELLALDRAGDVWTARPGWGKGRALQYVGGASTPDAEAATVADTDSAAVYVAAERSNDEPTKSRNSILRYETAGTGALIATREWRLNALLPTTSANAGIEGLTWIPDDVLVQAGFRTSAGVPYTPAGYPDHGGGIFAVGVEATGDVAFVALRANGEATLLASVPTGLRAVMEVVWSPVRGELWAQCDNGCDGRAAVMRPTGGSFVTETIVEPPAGLARLNLEGFALGRTCSGGTMTAVWSDDSATDGHALRQSTVSCATPAVGGTATTASVPTTATPAVTTAATSASTAPSATAPSTSTTTPPPPVTLLPKSSERTGAIAAAAVLALVVVGFGALVARARRRRSA